MNNNTHLPELFIKGTAQRLALGEDGSVGLCLPAPRAPLTCPAMALLQEPQRPLAWVGMPRRLRSDCSRPSMVSRPPLLVGPVGDGEPSSTELGPGGWVGPGAGRWFWTRKSESEAISLSSSRVAEVAEGFWRTGDGLGGPLGLFLSSDWSSFCSPAVSLLDGN